ncbi:MAG: radical SAM protein [Methylocystis sp.]|uniref:radical SAM/SPASM domain-containing protein n=1 Tax=Phenylobacterium sp. TaxID=1871053 RepID=UPI0025E71BBA|nr:radical SAM protein [Phenylobacterium sp.]MCA3585179.1 radical SAM protein [Methylocystis sp.]MCA6346664.1 radical SAM protein [Phenylobacterium sp.]MCA6349260.1 radical SAM protein [Phenylobacterium sp.]MCA6352222.1 radical SAM protein [Phenylobacterium sp.]MCA6355575.1 radical SAM protein [Phenylobacterium sp.]
MAVILDTSKQSSVASLLEKNKAYDKFEHYKLNVGPTDEYGDLPQTQATIRNIGWTLGNDCPYRCNHCYSMNAREKGRDMSIPMIDRIVEQLRINGVETVNLGGNEPLFTNGPKYQNTLLHEIIYRLVDAGIAVGLTTSGITILKLYEHHRDAFDMLNDVDVSFDSPFEEEHNKNRGAKIFHQAVESLEICQRHDKPHSCIMAGMKWNFTIPHIEALYTLAKRYDANIRVNPVKPVEPAHMAQALPPDLYYAGFSRLMELCTPVDLGEPPIAAVTDYQQARRCPCGRTSFRIHSITPDGKIYVSPCVYLHDYKAPLDLLEHDLIDIINSQQFRVFRQRNANPDHIEGCQGCSYLSTCGGGCSARSYLYHRHETGGQATMRARDPYCPRDQQPLEPFPQQPEIDASQRLVHMDYLCTWIGRPR